MPNLNRSKLKVPAFIIYDIIDILVNPALIHIESCKREPYDLCIFMSYAHDATLTNQFKVKIWLLIYVRHNLTNGTLLFYFCYRAARKVVNPGKRNSFIHCDYFEITAISLKFWNPKAISHYLECEQDPYQEKSCHICRSRFDCILFDYDHWNGI